MSKRAQLALMFMVVTIAIATQFGHSLDDPLITLRYAHNVLAGHGPVFNPGERVEGFTSPLHLVVAIVVAALPGGADLLKLKIASALFAYLVAHRAVLLIRRITLPVWGQVLGIVMIGGSWSLAWSASDALETSLSVWLVIWLVDLFVSRQAYRRVPLTGTIAALAILARPENALIVGAFALVALVSEQQVRPWARVRWVIAPIGVVIASTIVRLAYYGDPLPNTYYAKAVPKTRSIGYGIQYLADIFAREVGGTSHLGFTVVVAGLVTLAALLVAWTSPMSQQWRTARRWCGTLIASEVVFLLAAGGVNAQQPRFTGVLVVPLVLSVVMGLVIIVERLPARRIAVGGALVALVAAASMASLIHNGDSVLALRHGVNDTALIVHSGRPFSPIWAMSPSLVACAPAGSTIAASEVGLLGASRMNLRIVDVRGLTDRTIAHDAPAGDHFVFGVQQPDWFQASSVVGSQIVAHEPVAIILWDPAPTDHPILNNHYHVTAVESVNGFDFRTYARIGGPCDTGSKRQS